MKLPKAKTDIQIRFSDIDVFGHVSNSVYSQYFDLGRMHFTHELEKIEKQPPMVVASIHMDMRKEIRYQDSVYVETWVSRIGTKSLTMSQNIYSNGQLAAEGQVVMVGFDLESRKAVKLPAHWQASEVDTGH